MLRLAPVFLLTALATEEAHHDPCGEGVGDLRSHASAPDACRSCGGRMVYHQSHADGLGYTSCQQGDNMELGPCGVGVGDLREHARAAAACEACGGHAHFNPAMANSLGFTMCIGGEATEQQPRSEAQPGPCGTGVGDFTAHQGAIDECGACRGVLHYHPSSTGPGFTGCHWAADGEEDAPATTATTTIGVRLPYAEEASWMSEPMFLVTLGLCVVGWALLCCCALQMRRYLAKRSAGFLGEAEAPQATTVGYPQPPAPAEPTKGMAPAKDVHVEV